MVAVSYFLYLIENDPEKISDIELKYWQRPKGYRTLRKKQTPMIVKAHLSLDNFLSDHAVVFTAAKDRREAAEMRETLERDGHIIAFVQDMETLKEVGVGGLVDEYVQGYGLSENDRSNLNEYFASWEILRQCCGQQMSARWRNDMVPEKFKINKFGSHPNCPSYDIDAIEETFMKSELYSMIEKYPSVQLLNRPSLNDGQLNGTYCSSYNYLVRTQGLNIWGDPGGRPVRSNLDNAIKKEVKQGREGLKPEAHYLFPSTDLPLSARYREMWNKPENEKKAWVKAVTAAREGGKNYGDYGIETYSSADADDRSEDSDHEVNTDDNDTMDSEETLTVSLPSGQVTVAQNARQHATPTFPIRTHIVTQGRPRTATTLLFNMVAVSYFLYLIENDPEKISDIELKYWQRPKGYRTLRKKQTPMIVKAHLSLDNFLSDHAVVFTAAKDRREAAEMRETLERDGHIIAFVQDMETLKEVGVGGLVDEYVQGYGLSENDRSNLNEYFASWEILRQCCGQQMSARWRNDMVPEKFKINKFGSHPNCPSYDIDAIEETFMKSELYSMIEKYPSVQLLNRPSLNDGQLNGTYCSSYNYLVRTQGLNIWGDPGGRPVRSNLDNAIKKEVKQGREGLKPEAHYLFPSTDLPLSARYREMWNKPENEKKAWVKAVTAAREGGKSYDENGAETYSSAEVDDDANKDDADVDDENEESDDAIDEQDSGDESVDLVAAGGASSNDVGTATHWFDESHAIFLISFGEEAAQSTLVERCVLSLRRRGSWAGYIIVLTDAPHARYQNEWDDNVIVMHPLDQHLNAADGTPMKFTRDNTSLKSKRFKTFIIDYVGMDERLDEVELIYYLDIDIMAGDAMHNLFNEIEERYGVSPEMRSGGMSKMYFFTPLSKEWPLQGGTFIVERRSARHCLELWREEIDGMVRLGRGRDQDALRTVFNRIRSGEESKCELVRMDNENLITFPTPRTFNKLVRQSSYNSLIHISNSVFAKWIDEEMQTEYIHKVLQLSEEEKRSGKYGKAIVHAKKSDM